MYMKMTKILTMCAAMMLCGTIWAAAPVPGQNFDVLLRGTQPRVKAAADELTYQWYKDNEPIYDATESSYTIEKVKKEDEGSYWVTISNGTDSVTSDEATLTVESEEPEIRMYRVKSEGLANASTGYGADDPLVPVADEDRLAAALVPVSKGLAADGVTPLVFKLHFPGKEESETRWELQRSCISTGYWDSLAQSMNWYLLQNGRFQLCNGEKTVLTVPAHPEGGADVYMYLSAVPSDKIILTKLYDLKISAVGNEEVSGEIEFKVVRPPLVLIHGFNTKGEWGDGFKGVISVGHEESLVYELHYGVFDGDYTANTYGTFAQLTKQLNVTLLTDVEGLQGPTLWDGWACTRYDVVAHSQGGVLTRLLCSKDPAWGGAFRGKANHYRGRFNRIVTIGSPQNGTSLIYYLLQMKKTYSTLLSTVLPTFCSNLYQSRFDPWGQEIRQINSIEIDPAAKFHAVATEVNSANIVFVLLGLYFGQFGSAGVDVLLPKGSDSVVDLESQLAGAAKKSTYFDDYDLYVAHAMILDSFMTRKFLGANSVQTTSTSLASYVNKLFENNNNFGFFTRPARASESWRKRIDNSMAAISASMNLVDYLVGKPIKFAEYAITFLNVEALTSDILNYFFPKDTVTAAADSGIKAIWSAEVYGPNGVTLDGVTLEEDSERDFGVNVKVADSVVGEVVLYGCFYSEDGRVLYAKPQVVYSNPPGKRIVSIECVPSTLTMMVGDMIDPELWATYETGVKSRLFVGMDTPLTFISSDAQIVKVNGHGLEAIKNGSAVITAEYKGLRTTLQYQVGNDDSDVMLFSCGEDGLMLVFAGTLQESTDMKNWKTLNDAESPYTVQTTDSQKFYRSFFSAVIGGSDGGDTGEEGTIKEGENFTTSLSDTVNLDMIWCPPGTFMMGSPTDELGRDGDETQHQVTLTKGYWIGKYEVTQGQYEAIMGKNPSTFQAADLPVEYVTWYDATNFCTKLTEIERAAGRLPEGYEYTLPTEAQWEYACRAGTTMALNSGKNLSSLAKCPEMDEVGWYYNNSDDATHSAGQKKPNAWGLYDMHGNVCEWCLDWYGSYPSSAVTDTKGVSAGSYRVGRGGSWSSYARYCRSAVRYYFDPGYRSNGFGFRVALVPIR